jgi:hypothetical protein
VISTSCLHTLGKFSFNHWPHIRFAGKQRFYNRKIRFKRRFHQFAAELSDKRMTGVIPADIQPHSLCGTDNLDDVPILEDMIFLDPHLCPGVNSVQKSFSNFRVDLESKIVGIGSFLHKERIG